MSVSQVLQSRQFSLKIREHLAFLGEEISHCLVHVDGDYVTFGPPVRTQESFFEGSGPAIDLPDEVERESWDANYALAKNCFDELMRVSEDMLCPEGNIGILSAEVDLPDDSLVEKVMGCKAENTGLYNFAFYEAFCELRHYAYLQLAMLSTFGDSTFYLGGVAGEDGKTIVLKSVSTSQIIEPRDAFLYCEYGKNVLGTEMGEALDLPELRLPLAESFILYDLETRRNEVMATKDPFPYP